VSFDDDERSVSQSRPIDLYTITTPTATYRLTSHPVDVAYAGNVYTATTMSRGDQQVQQDTTGRELVVYLPVAHPVVQQFAATGVPPHGVKVTLLRLQTVSMQAQQSWSGFATGLNIRGHMAMFRVPSVTDDALKVTLPVVRAQKRCNHVLFDKQCSPSPGIDGPTELSYTIIAKLVSQTVTPGAVTVVVDSVIGNPDGWFTFGGASHLATVQLRSVLGHVGTTLILNEKFVGAQPGDLIGLVAGCAHDVDTCESKFVNVQNFGGMPHLNNTVQPYTPGSLGVITQE